jgi:hypothetical protein
LQVVVALYTLALAQVVIEQQAVLRLAQGRQ